MYQELHTTDSEAGVLYCEPRDLLQTNPLPAPANSAAGGPTTGNKLKVQHAVLIEILDQC